MAKRKNQKRAAAQASSTSANSNEANPTREVDVKKLIIMLIMLSIVLLPVVVLTKQAGAINEEVISNGSKVSATKKEQQQRSTLIDPSTFSGVWKMNSYFTKNYDSKVR